MMKRPIEVVRRTHSMHRKGFGVCEISKMLRIPHQTVSDWISGRRRLADPKLRLNVHDICVRSKAGEFATEARNVSFSDTPKTSYLAALSAIRTLHRMTEVVCIGT